MNFVCARCHRPMRSGVLIAGAIYGPKCARSIKAPSLWQRLKAWVAQIWGAMSEPFDWERT